MFAWNVIYLIQDSCTSAFGECSKTRYEYGIIWPSITKQPKVQQKLIQANASNFRKFHFSSRAAVWRILRVSIPPAPWRSCATGWHHWRCQGAEELGVLEGPRDPEGGELLQFKKITKHNMHAANSWTLRIMIIYWRPLFFFAKDFHSFRHWTSCKWDLDVHFPTLKTGQANMELERWQHVLWEIMIHNINAMHPCIVFNLAGPSVIESCIPLLVSVCVCVSVQAAGKSMPNWPTG